MRNKSWALAIALLACETQGEVFKPPAPPAFHEIEGRIYTDGFGDRVALGVAHDDDRHVTCWLATGAGYVAMQCLPDTSLVK